MTIQPNNNVETAKILRDLFPKDDEDTFIADAETQIKKVTELYRLADDLSAAERVTRETLRGATGEAYHESMHLSREQILGMANDHLNLAKALEVAASNIATTKANLNDIDYHYHSNMQSLQEWSMANNVPQNEVVEHRQQMLESALSAVDTSAEELELSQSKVHTAVKNGVPVDYSALIPLRETAEASKYTLPEAGGSAYSSPEYRQGLTSDMEKTITASARTSAHTDTTAGGASAVFSRTTTSEGQVSQGEQPSVLRKSPVETSLSSASTATTASASGGVIGGKPAGFTSTSTSANPTPAATQAPAAMMPVGGVPAATKAASTGGLLTPTVTPAAQENKAAGSVAGRKLKAGFTPEDVIPVTKHDEDDQPADKTDLQRALEHVEDSELLEVLPRQVQACAIVAANLWSGLQLSGWDGAVAVAPVAGTSDSFIYVTEHLVSFVPHTLRTHPRVSPAEAHLSQDVLSKIATSDIVSKLAAVEGLDLEHAVVVAPSEPTHAAFMIERTDALEIASSFEVRDGQLHRALPNLRDFECQRIDEIVSLADKELRAALMDVVFAAQNDTDEYVSALRAFVASAMRVAQVQGWDQDFAYLESTFNYL